MDFYEYAVMAFTKVDKIEAPEWTAGHDRLGTYDNLLTETEVNILLETGYWLLSESSGANWTVSTAVTNPTWSGVTSVTDPTWSLVDSVTTPIWSNVTNAWAWENKTINWEDENYLWENSGI